MTAEELLARVLAEHEMFGKSLPADPDHECRIVKWPFAGGCGCTRPVVACSGCDWTADPDGHQGEAFRSHVAAAQVAALREAGLLPDLPVEVTPADAVRRYLDLAERGNPSPAVRAVIAEERARLDAKEAR